MANLAVLRSARLLGNRQWQHKAVARMSDEAPKAWSAAGSTWEQSTMYQGVNSHLWSQAAAAIQDARGGAGIVSRIRALAAKADAVFAWMTEPDGGIAIIGDALDVPGTTRPGWTTRMWHDDEAGFGIGRWSWRDRSTTYYTIRYGPPMRAHGHQDRGGVTWSTLGARVLVNAGLFTYDPSNRFIGYQDGPASANVAIPSRRTIDPRAAVHLARTSFGADSHQWVLTDRLFGLAHQRGVLVLENAHTLTVADAYAVKGTSFVQKFHLDPSWTLVALTDGARTARFARSGGRRLTVTTTGALSLLKGSTRPVAGWHFPAFGARVPGDELTVTATTTASTAFAVS
jgi:hypothetical protein